MKLFSLCQETSSVNKATTNFHALRACLLLLCISGSSYLHAGIACDINGAALAFGMYDPSEKLPTDGVGTVNLSCTNFNTVAPNGATVALSISSVSSLKMIGNGDALDYGIYSNSARSISWGNGLAAPTLSTGAMQANETKALRFTVYGRIPPLQNIAAGSYADSLLITVTP